MPVSDTKFFGGAIYNSISATLDLHPYRRVWTIVATAGQSVVLPDATLLREGGPYFYIINLGAPSFDLEDNDNTVLDTVAGSDTTAESVLVALAVNGSAAGTWYTLRRASVV